MRFRALLAHLKQQNWMAVVIDFVIVVVGVFFGIQVSNWNEVRKQQQASTVFTQRLTNDLLEEAWNYQYLIEYYKDVESNAELTLAVLEERQSVDDEAFLIAAYRATQFSLDTRRRATFDELISTGKLDLINDNMLREAAMRVYSFPVFDVIRTAGQMSEYRKWFRKHVPMMIQQNLLENCGDKYVDIHDYESIKNSLDYPCSLNIPQTAIAATTKTLRDNVELLYRLRLRYSQLQSNLSSLEVYYPEVRQGLAEIRAKYRLTTENSQNPV